MIGNSSFKVGIYIRLSRDDGNIESDSIISQRSLLNQYIKENNYSLIDEYVDDGFTGTNFERPSFKRMIKDIESGKINMIITKDMSRLGRDYIGTGELIEKYFPNKNVRYIAINDGIDTFIDNTNNDIAPFKAIMNDMYAKDISKKVKTSLHSRMKEGLYVSGRCPFGYMKDPNNKNHLVVNNEQAEVVKLIFDLALKGNTYHYIAQKLTKRKIKTPASYYNYVWNTKCSTECISQEYGVWVDTTIKAILTNRIYVGDVVQGKTKKINYKLKKTVKNKPNDFIIVENTHEAIIDRDTFNYVQTLLPKNVKRPEKKRFYLLDGLLYCGDCKHRITIRYQTKTGRSYTTCDYYRTYSKYHVCTTHTNNYETLEKVILDNIKDVCKNYLNKNKIKDSEIENLKEQIKEHISTSGSVKASIYMPNFDNNVHINLKSGAIYNLIDSYEDIKKEMTKKDGVYVNHAVSIIGWDDNYSKDNFSTKPTNNGAWIIRNSYGKAIEISMEQLRKNNPGLEDEEIVNTFSASMNCNCTLSEDGQILSVSVGDNGIFYISYEDSYIYSDLLGIENAEDKKDYDNLYQYDNLGGGEVGYIKGNDVKDIFLANVFTRTKTDTEYLTSIGFQSLVEGTYEVYINPDGTDKSLSNLQKAELTTGEEISLTAGYHTINFKKAYKLKENNFVVAIKMKHKDGGISYFTYEAKEENPDIVLSKAKESFVVREEQAQKDSQWLDIGDSSSSSYLGNLCIKGITVNQYSGSIANEEEKEDSKTDNNNSNYDKAKAELQELKLEGNNQESSVNIKIKVTGIEVKN